jgi:hypothetical protein
MNVALTGAPQGRIEIVGGGTVLSIIGTHLYAVGHENNRECWNAKSGKTKVYLRRILI